MPSCPYQKGNTQFCNAKRSPDTSFPHSFTDRMDDSPMADAKTSFLIRCCCAMICWLSMALYYASPTQAQSFYPHEVGNTWLLRSPDGVHTHTVTIKPSAPINGEAVNLIENNIDGDVVQFFTKSEPDGIKLLRSVVSPPVLNQVTFDYNPPQFFLPTSLDLASRWTIESLATLPHIGAVGAISRAEVVAIEDVVMPAGTFRDCLKIVQNTTFDLGTTAGQTSTTMWLAPDIGPVKMIDWLNVIFELRDYHIAEPVPADPPPVRIPRPPPPLFLFAADDWTQKFPASNPSARVVHYMAYVGGD